MCGIVGAISKRDISTILIDGLKRLEYRGYDSAGIATIDENRLQRRRVVGKVQMLDDSLKKTPLAGSVGIAHTRWATHGAPTEDNAHPFLSNDEFALVHNGIIENYVSLRENLIKEGYTFASQTDTEVVVHLIHKHFKDSKNMLDALAKTVQQLEGAYSLGILSRQHPDKIFAIRQGSPLVVGKGQGENFIASDPLALISVCRDFIYLEDKEIAEVSLAGINIYDANKQRIERAYQTIAINNDSMEKGLYRHYMQKEIMEQPKAIAACLEGRIVKDKLQPAVFGHGTDVLFRQAEHVQLIACGTSYHAALTAKYWIESIAEMPCSVEVASEFRYRDSAHPKNSFFVTLSQSGETADTLAALRLAKSKDYLMTLAICNVANSSMTREAGMHFLTRAGIEIGVASTKAFTTQLVSLLLLALSIRREKHGEDGLVTTLTRELAHLPTLIEMALKKDEVIRALAHDLTHKQHALFLGRGALYPIALEGALKMKEISYIHAEGYPAGELKHGPLALVDVNMPVIAVVPNDGLLDKCLSNLQEVRARGGCLYVITDLPNAFTADAFREAACLALPETAPALAPILYTIPLQLFAYHVAVLKGTDVDQPRNLAKSVTVE